MKRAGMSVMVDEQWPLFHLDCEECKDDAELDILGLDEIGEGKEMSSLMSFLGPSNRLHKSAQQAMPKHEIGC